MTEYPELDRERIISLLRELLEALGEDASGTAARTGTRHEVLKEPDGERLLNTAEAARRLRVAQKWVVDHIDEFPGAFRLTEGQRANYRIPISGVEAFERNRRIVNGE